MARELRTLVESELVPGEKLIWLAQPQPGEITKKVLAAWIFLLTALYLESVSLLNQAQGEILPLLTVREGALILFAAIGVMLLVHIPRQAAATIYAVTDKRVLKFDRSRIVHKSIAEKYQRVGRAVVYFNASSVEHFWYKLVAHIFVLVMWCALFLPQMLSQFDAQTGLGVIITVGVLASYMVEGMHWPLPKYRRAAGTLYSIKSQLVYIESFPWSEITEIRTRLARNGTGDLFFLSSKQGCMRMRAVADAAQFSTMLVSSQQVQPIAAVETVEQELS